MESLKKHFPHYLSLIGIFIAGIIGFYFYPFDRFFQIGIIVSIAFAYVSWGIIHHAIHKDICFTIILEYVAIAILGVVMAISLIYRT